MVHQVVISFKINRQRKKLCFWVDAIENVELRSSCAIE
ncbi:hypothetical protein F442_15283 [Phytophthora nicotianae P10297]|uniref:Uncharacterized protein n=3 Tax=Phytophthora nicotianae TaxID=4792 RepID=W2R3M2_PHYN3|nr:hypothetical protein PPTG_21411 [Phytophthora nicotianae INRA-310]ETM38958.1 hypothetical protein L914_14842 [Phytophthora nicotianae]ETN19110.1 hypothetical protein PPTG_21411 [Phytophthora nicotianae INRA-310]ETP36857.1 hypothetical protein F442_15283 [Phytophthora nicotianae P10297]